MQILDTCLISMESDLAQFNHKFGGARCKGVVEDPADGFGNGLCGRVWLAVQHRNEVEPVFVSWVLDHTNRNHLLLVGVRIHSLVESHEMLAVV